MVCWRQTIDDGMHVSEAAKHVVITKRYGRGREQRKEPIGLIYFDSG